MKVCLASIHPRMLSGQIEALIALRSALESVGHEATIVSAFTPAQLQEQRRWAVEYGDGLSLAPKVVRIGRILSRIAAAARDCDVLHFNVPTPAFGMLGDVLQLWARRPVVLGFEAHLADVPAVAGRLGGRAGVLRAARHRKQRPRRSGHLAPSTALYREQ